MSLPRYPKYRDSGVKWLGKVPEHWEVNRLKFLAHVRGGVAKGRDLGLQKTIQVPYLRVANVQDGYLDLDEISMIEIAKNELERYSLHPGDVLMNEGGDFDKLGRGHIWRGEITDCVHQNHVFAVRPRRVESEWLNLVASAEYARFYFMSRSKQSTNLASISSSNIQELPVVCPPPAERQLIIESVNVETNKIDTLIKEQQLMIELLNERVTALVLSSIGSTETREVRFSSAARIVKRPVFQQEDESYTPIGLFNRGRGLFHKDAREIDEMGDSDFFWIEEGDLIISGQFAWEGAVALAGAEDAGCVVSHRYPVLRGIPGTSLTQYLFALLMTKHGDFLLNENSRGAAGRNRPLNINSLLKERVPIPDMRTQERVAQAVHCRKTLLSEMSKQVEFLKERRSALISAAVTGQIDVRNYCPQEASVVCQ
jgi:type I restriction enzyme S subunit